MTIWEISEKADYIAQRHRRLQDQWHIYCNSLVQGITLSKARLHHAMSCAPDKELCFVLFEHFRIYVTLADGFNSHTIEYYVETKEGKLWFALGRLGTLLLAIACWLLWQRYGTLDLRLLDMRMQQLPLGSDIWLLGVIGFGLLAGIIPLHGWVPQAHANASAPAAALFSTVVMKIGLLGILTLSLLGGNAPLWWGSCCWCSA